MKLAQIRVIDLGSSVIDEKKSNPKKGEYVFISKRYVSYQGAGPRPNWFFTWERYTPVNGFREIEDAKSRGFSFVEAGIDPYAADSVTPNALGYYVFGDLVLMKCPLLMELERRVEQAELSKGAGKAKLAAFRQEVRAEGGEVSEDLMSLLGN
jgi:hypothetical protein